MESASCDRTMPCRVLRYSMSHPSWWYANAESVAFWMTSSSFMTRSNVRCFSAPGFRKRDGSYGNPADAGCLNTHPPADCSRTLACIERNPPARGDRACRHRLNAAGRQARRGHIAPAGSAHVAAGSRHTGAGHPARDRFPCARWRTAQRCVPPLPSTAIRLRRFSMGRRRGWIRQDC